MSETWARRREAYVAACRCKRSGPWASASRIHRVRGQGYDTDASCASTFLEDFAAVVAGRKRRFAQAAMGEVRTE
jgi:hypothetical protein